MGQSSPRNHRETIIFKLYHALQDQRYADAYQLHAWHRTPSRPTLQKFIEEQSQQHNALPTVISIGTETRNHEDGDHHCGYHYVVYVAVPGHATLMSGIVAMHSNPQNPKACLIGYNSAF